MQLRFWLARRFLQYHLPGIEMDGKLVVGCRTMADWLNLRRLRFDQGGLAAVPLKGPYDLIFSIDVLEHIVDAHVRDEYTPGEIRAKLTQAGFEVRQFMYALGSAGELAVELYLLFWDWPALRSIVALMTFPLAIPLAFWDVRHPPERGNAFIVLAAPSNE